MQNIGVVVYVIGIPWLAVVANMELGKAAAGSAIFVPGDLAKAVVASFAALIVKRSYPLIRGADLSQCFCSSTGMRGPAASRDANLLTGNGAVASARDRSVGGSVLDLVAAQDENRFRALMQAHYLGALPGIGETLPVHRGQWLAHSWSVDGWSRGAHQQLPAARRAP